MTPGSWTDRLVVLVVSCDRYADVWGPFFALLRRFWPDCPFRVYLLTNHLKPEIPGVTVLPVGEDRSWSENVRKAVETFKEEYVLMWIDDLLLREPVRPDQVEALGRWMADARPNYVRWNPSEPPDRPFDERVGVVSKGSVYRTSTVLSAWKRSVLLALLKDGETAWDFEIEGSVRSDRYDGFFSTWRDHVPVANGIIKGRWDRRVVKLLQGLGVPADLSRRREMTKWESAVWWMKRLRTKVFQWVPAPYRRTVKQWCEF